MDLIHWLAAHPIYPKVFWKDRDQQVIRAAVGNLLFFSRIPSFSGPVPFDIRPYGGIRFTEKHPHDDTTWQGFPRTCFWLPEIELSKKDGKTEAVFHFFQEKLCLKSGHFEIQNLSIPPFEPKAWIDRLETPNFAIWQKNVNEVLKAIAEENLHKLVLARRTSLQFSKPISVWSCLNHLLNQAKNANVFAFQLSPTLCFLGATPEKLFESNGNDLSTDVLAGTRPRGKTPEEDLKFEQDLLGSTKERQEFNIRLLSKLALFDKISNFCADLLKNFESMCNHMVEKFYSKGAENGK